MTQPIEPRHTLLDCTVLFGEPCLAHAAEQAAATASGGPVDGAGGPATHGPASEPRAYPAAHGTRVLPSEWANWGRLAESDYELLRDVVIAAFNPPDDDIAEVALMANTIDKAWGFIVRQPCTCPPGAATFDVDPCARCEVLGRAADVRVER